MLGGGSVALKLIWSCMSNEMERKLDIGSF